MNEVFTHHRLFISMPRRGSYLVLAILDFKNAILSHCMLRCIGNNEILNLGKVICSNGNSKSIDHCSSNKSLSYQLNQDFSFCSLSTFHVFVTSTSCMSSFAMSTSLINFTWLRPRQLPLQSFKLIIFEHRN